MNFKEILLFVIILNNFDIGLFFGKSQVSGLFNLTELCMFCDFNNGWDRRATQMGPPKKRLKQWLFDL